MISDREIWRAMVLIWQYSSPCWRPCRECMPGIPCPFHLANTLEEIEAVSA